jgi:hypothetical protein
MSNKIVPTIYRSVIDEVISAIKPEFDEYGVDENVLADLQQVSLTLPLPFLFQSWRCSVFFNGLSAVEMAEQSDSVACRPV